MSLQKDDNEIYPIPVLTDNIIWLWSFKGEAIVVDPALTEPVQNFLKAHKLKLKAILQTHHHSDHIGGTPGLLNLWPKAEVIASRNDIKRIPFQTKSVKDKDIFSLMGITIEVLEVSGHTSNHIAFFISDKQKTIDSPLLFSGDTLFGAGCGRLFEGSPKDMFNSFNKFKRLPFNTKVYCAHEYTESNLRWANSLYPKDLSIKKRLIDVIKKREEGLSSLPSSIKEEEETNLFFRAKTIKEFSELRRSKDSW